MQNWFLFLPRDIVKKDDSTQFKRNRWFRTIVRTYFRTSEQRRKMALGDDFIRWLIANVKRLD